MAMGAEFGCISKGLADFLVMFIDQGASQDTLKQIVSAFPRCPDGNVPVAKLTERKRPANWPAAIYFDEDGDAEPFDSPSELYTHLTGEKVSGQVCDDEGKSCRALSLIDNFTIKGFVVRGDGEAPPLSIGSRSQIENKAQAWKQHLLNEGLDFMVFHPDCPYLKEASKKAEAVAKVKKK